MNGTLILFVCIHLSPKYHLSDLLVIQSILQYYFCIDLLFIRNHLDESSRRTESSLTHDCPSLSCRFIYCVDSNLSLFTEIYKQYISVSSISIYVLKFIGTRPFPPMPENTVLITNGVWYHIGITVVEGI